MGAIGATARTVICLPPRQLFATTNTNNREETTIARSVEHAIKAMEAVACSRQRDPKPPNVFSRNLALLQNTIMVSVGSSFKTVINHFAPKACSESTN